MALVYAAVLGVVQGLTEFLPVSSTAHLLLGERLLGFDDPTGAFAVMIQLGSILAVMWVYRARIFGTIAGLGSDAGARRFAASIVVAVVPALVVGGLFSGFVKSVLYRHLWVWAVSFVLGGVVMLAIERALRIPDVSRGDQVPLGRAFGVGVCQTLAIVPGVSRSGATIIGGMAMGLDRAAAAEFSFFVAIPTMSAAFAHDLLELRSALRPEFALDDRWRRRLRAEGELLKGLASPWIARCSAYRRPDARRLVRKS